MVVLELATLLAQELVAAVAVVVAVAGAVAVLEAVLDARHAVLVPIYVLEGAADPVMQDVTMDANRPVYHLVTVLVLRLVRDSLHHQSL